MLLLGIAFLHSKKVVNLFIFKYLFLFLQKNNFTMRLFILSNRLPIKVRKTGQGTFEYLRSEGGLATGLGSMELPLEKHWIGWPGIHLEEEEDIRQVTDHLESLNFHPVFLSESQIANFYEGYSNSILWPLCHYFYSFIEYESTQWEMYKEVNRIFGEIAATFVKPGDIVWIHDYQLMLLPKIVRDTIPEVSIGYFHHIPFPSYELFRVLPERAEILNGLLGADLVAFHTHDYMRHFISAAERVLDLQFVMDQVLIGNRMSYVDAFPMGINYTLYSEAVLKPEIQEKAKALHENFGKHKIILSVDRLDYSKGILHRLKGFAQFLEFHPEYRGKVSLVMIVVPSRFTVDRYASLKTKIDETIGSINGKYSTINWTPIYYFYHSLDFEELVAMYHIADIALISPLRDGMNLVAKEYVAAKRDKPGVLILSEMAGAATELSDAIVINPNNVDQIEWAIVDALEMSLEEQFIHMERMQKVVGRQTVEKWANDFIRELESICQKNREDDKKYLDEKKTGQLHQSYTEAQNRLIILDYDGTLAPFQFKPEDAFPTPDILQILEDLVSDARNKIVISSGRDQNTLEKWFGHLPLTLAAEHGAFYKENGAWNKKPCNQSWNDELLKIFQQFQEKTPRSILEKKDTALVWHYRKVDGWLATIREQQLVNALITPCTKLHLQIMRGNKIVEVKMPEYTKGAEARRLMEKDHYDFILAMGDDTTDEDTFSALPKTATTVKVGGNSNAARFSLCSQSDVLPFLRSLIKGSGTDESGQCDLLCKK
jgi:trehalose 6-phosphate synthase/phosphatase